MFYQPEVHVHVPVVGPTEAQPPSSPRDAENNAEVVGEAAKTVMLLLLLASTSGPFSPVAPALPHQQCIVNPGTADGLWCRLRGGGDTCEACSPTAPIPPSFLNDVRDWHPVLLAFLGTSFGWFMTALGSAAVIIHKLGLSESTYRKVLDFMLGISGGVMTAASYWSLLAPALEFAELQGWGEYSYVPVALGFLSGGALLQGTDWMLSRMQGSLEELDLYRGLAVNGADGEQSAAVKGERVSQLRRLLLLILAITIHNFPEGMAVGVAFGAIGSAPGATFGSAATLALGIGIQNFPEGLAVSMPLMRQGVSPLKSLWSVLPPKPVASQALPPPTAQPPSPPSPSPSPLCERPPPFRSAERRRSRRLCAGTASSAASSSPSAECSARPSCTTAGRCCRTRCRSPPVR